jgi:signal transduction histidine kinase
MKGWRPSAVALDATLALVLTVLYLPGATDDQGALRQPASLVVPLALAQTLPLAFRRLRPLTVLAVTLVAGIVFNAGLADSPTLPVGVVISLYTVASHCHRSVAVRAGLVTGVALPWPILYAADFQVDTALFSLGLTAGAWLVGDNVRTRRAYLAELEAKAVRLEREREEEARRAVAREQARIARELHDVISHNVSVMVVQAAAGADVFEAQPARAHSALTSIEATGREALTELRRLLGVIRTDEESDASFAPQPGLERLDGLLEQIRAAGLAVELTVEGWRSPLPPGLDLAAYRIVQEALTNTLKHAGASRAGITLRYGASELEVDVLDDGRGPAANGAPGGGRGLVGMRERVALYGGRVDAGPRAEGGFLVSARFPLSREEPR